MSTETLPISSISFLVEGKDEEIVCSKILAKCRKIKINKTDINGITKIIPALSAALKDPEIQKIAVILDADKNFDSIIESICSNLKVNGFIFPKYKKNSGLITNQVTSNIVTKKIVGVWIMPNHESNGMLEDFLINIIPQNDSQKNSVNEFLNKLEELELNLYNKDLHRSKAFIHCWLSIQKSPGKPFGQAIDMNLFNLKTLSENSYLYHFLNWYDTLEKIEIVED